MYKRVAQMAFVIVFCLTIITAMSVDDFEKISLQGHNENWSIENASLTVSLEKQAIDGGTLIYTGTESLNIKYLEVDIINKNAADTKIISLYNYHNYYIDYASIMKVGDMKNIGGYNGYYYLNENPTDMSNLDLVAKVTYSLSDDNEVRTEIIELENL